MILLYIIIGIIIFYLLCKHAKKTKAYPSSSGYHSSLPKVKSSFKTRIKTYNLTNIEINLNTEEYDNV